MNCKLGCGMDKEGENGDSDRGPKEGLRVNVRSYETAIKGD